jgi:hypothetical protein
MELTIVFEITDASGQPTHGQTYHTFALLARSHDSTHSRGSNHVVGFLAFYVARGHGFIQEVTDPSGSNEWTD